MFGKKKNDKWLQAAGKYKYVFVGQKGATKEEREELKKRDMNNWKMFGFHLISNYEDLDLFLTDEEEVAENQVVRKASMKDVEDIMNIYNYEVENSHYTLDREARSLKQTIGWMEEHMDGTHFILVSEAEGHVNGYVAVSRYQEHPFFDLTAGLTIYVHQDARGKGIGSCLLAEALSQAGKTGELHTLLAAVSGEDDKSCQLYEKFGFQKAGTLKEVLAKNGAFGDVVLYERLLQKK